MRRIAARRARKQGACHQDQWHGLSCATVVAKQGRDKHDAVGRAIQYQLHSIGVHCRLEPRGDDRKDGRRPDFETQLPGHHLILGDVTCPNPVAPSHVKRAAGKALAVAEDAATAKRTKYADYARERDADFVPFVVEAHGGMCKEAVAFIAKVRKAAAREAHWYERESECDLLHTIAVAVQRGNFAAMQRAMRVSD